MKLNIPPFYIGQEVIYIKSEWFPKYSKHIVTYIGKCQCGCWEIYVDGKSWGKNDLKGQNVSCKECCKMFVSNENEIGYFASDFKGIEKMKTPLLTFEKIKEKEKKEILIMN